MVNMEKLNAVAELGASRLLLPGWIKAALGANDRLKLYLTVLQCAENHARNPGQPPVSLKDELAAANVKDEWLLELPHSAAWSEQMLYVADLQRLTHLLADDLQVMSRPLMVVPKIGQEMSARVAHWEHWLRGLPADKLTQEDLKKLSSGRHGIEDGVHILVMDLHKKINQLAADIADELIDGAHVWQLQDEDKARVAAFMRGLNRTAYLKFDHPGLDTAATRDGAKLLIQNDIGTNDAHVLVIQVEGVSATLTYSDLHRQRFGFFQGLLADLGANWSIVEPRISGGLNRGETYFVGTAHFEASDEASLQAYLDGVASKIVFLIDWNRARKRLQCLVDRTVAIDVLKAAAELSIGHRAWLEAGAEHMVFAAMQALGAGAFQLGDRLDTVLGREAAKRFLIDVLRLAMQAAAGGQPPDLVQDEARLRLAKEFNRKTEEFDLLAEHAAWCHALGQGLRDALSHALDKQQDKLSQLAVRAKGWERRADELVMRVRDLQAQQPRWRRIVRLIECSDDVADALEEAVFSMSLLGDLGTHGWGIQVRAVLLNLAETVLGALQDHNRALSQAMGLADQVHGDEQEAFLASIWSVLQAERQCDELLRIAKRVILKELDQPAQMVLALDVAQAMELASDHQLRLSYLLREMVFARAESQV